MTTIAHPELEGFGNYRFGWADADTAGASARRGLSEDVVRDISAKKHEPEWMLDLRLRGLKMFGRKPLPTYFRINGENMGQFERTLIIVDEGAWVHYVEGCTAPVYKSDSLHSAVVEIIVKKDARCRYTTIQNWSGNVYNLVTKRAVAQAGATMEWIDGNIGSKVTMKYPAVYLMGEHARGETLSVAFAGPGQHQDAGAKMVHAAPNTSSTIVSKSVARSGGRTSYRGLVNVQEGAGHARSTVRCDALLVDTISRSDTYPYVDVREDDVEMGHEASVSKISEDQLFYL